MPEVHVTPEYLEEFAVFLRNFNATLEQDSSKLRQELNALGDTWLDQEYVRFVEEFHMIAQQIEKFLPASADMVPILLKKAYFLREYSSR